MDDALTERVEALERAVTDGDHDLSALAEGGAALERLESLESRLDTLETQLEEIDAATQALRGYVGNVRSVNQRVESRADTALAKVESLEETATDGAVTRELSASQSSPGAETETSSEQSSETRQQSLSSTTARDAGQPAVRTTDSPPDGDAGPAVSSSNESQRPAVGMDDTDETNDDSDMPRCHACGRTRSADDSTGRDTRSQHERCTDTQPTAQAATDGSVTAPREETLTDFPESPFEPDDSEETGRLQRFRDLL